MIKKISFAAVIIMFLGLNISNGQSSIDGSGFINVNTFEFNEMIKSQKGDVLDVRTAREFQSGHIEGAKNVIYTMFGFENALKDLERNKTYYIYCRSGSRSGRAMKIMKKEGFENVYNLNGGLMKWKSEGMPIIK